jgi:prophage regulatory protein
MNQKTSHLPINRAQLRALRLPAVLEKTGLSRSQLFRLIQQGTFPPSHKLSERVSVWDEGAIDTFLAEKFGEVMQ